MTAQSSTASPVKQQIIFLVLAVVKLLDLARPAQVFSMAASLGAPYSLHFSAAQVERDQHKGYSWNNGA